jgi:hypothetical protein
MIVFLLFQPIRMRTDKVVVQFVHHYVKNLMLMNHNMHGNNSEKTFKCILQSFFYSVSIPKYRVNSNIYQFRPPKRAHLSDLSADSVALANVIIQNLY